MEKTPDNAREQPKICSLDSLKIGQTYAFDPPLDIADITIISKHNLGGPKARHPNFLKEDIKVHGVSRGQLIYKSEYTSEGKASGTFACEAKFHNRITGQMEVARYTTICKFSRQSAEGIQVQIRKLIDQNLGE